MEGTLGRVAYLAVGLNDVLSGGETIFHVTDNVPEDLGKESLIFCFKGQPVSVFFKAIDEILAGGAFCVMLSSLVSLTRLEVL